MNKLIMAADKLKKLEARGRAALIQGDITAATRFFTQALERYSSPDCFKTQESKQALQRKTAFRTTTTRPILKADSDAEDQVWILQSSSKTKRNKKTEKKSDKKIKDYKETLSGVEILDGIIADAETGIKTYPCYPLGYLKKASALILLNRWDEARKTYLIGLTHCPEKTILKSALINLNRTYKITACAARLDMEKLSDLVNQNGPSPSPSFLPSSPSTLKRNKFRLQSRRRLTKKVFSSEDDDISSQIVATYFRRRNSSSTDTHL